MTVAEVTPLLILCFLAFFLGDYGSRYAGWLAWVPACVLGTMVLWVAVLGAVVAKARGQIVAILKKFQKGAP